MADPDIEEVLAAEAQRFEAENETPSERRYVRPRPPVNPSQVYSIRIPVDRLEEVRGLAEQEGKRPSAMLREWVLERLDREKKSEHSVIRKPIPSGYVVGNVKVFVSHDWRFQSDIGSVHENMLNIARSCAYYFPSDSVGRALSSFARGHRERSNEQATR